MFAPTRRPRLQLDRAVESLPDRWAVLATEVGWVVVGPNGVFVVGGADPDVLTAASAVARTAAEVREMLAERVSWAPFVDALVVVDGEASPVPCAGVVPVRFLGDLLRSGPAVLSPEQVARMAAALS